MRATQLRLDVEGGGGIAPCRALAWIHVQRSGVQPPRLPHTRDAPLPTASGRGFQEAHELAQWSAGLDSGGSKQSSVCLARHIRCTHLVKRPISTAVGCRCSMSCFTLGPTA